VPARRAHSFAHQVRSLTPLVQVGLALVLVGACADVAFHVLGPLWPAALNAVFGVDGLRAHLLTLVGMLVAVVGLVVQARTSSAS
jgi:hypothetical protein